MTEYRHTLSVDLLIVYSWMVSQCQVMLPSFPRSCISTVHILTFSILTGSVGWTPSFLLKRFVLMGIPNGPHEPFIADSVDFVVSQVKSQRPK